MNQNAGQGTGLRERDGINVIHTRMQVIIVAWQDAKNHFIVSPFAGPRAGSRSLFLVFRALFIGLIMKQKKKEASQLCSCISVPQRSRSPTAPLQTGASLPGLHVKHSGGGCRTSDFAYVVDRLVG